MERHCSTVKLQKNPCVIACACVCVPWLIMLTNVNADQMLIHSFITFVFTRFTGFILLHIPVCISSSRLPSGDAGSGEFPARHRAPGAGGPPGWVGWWGL